MKFNFPTNWKLVPLEKSMETIIDYRGKTPQKTSAGIPLITAKIVKNGCILTPNEFISPDDYNQWMIRGLPNPGDVVLTTEAPLGEVAQLKDLQVALAQRIITLRGMRDFLHNDFLLFLLQSDYVQHQLHSRSSGSTVKGIKQKELKQILLPIPPYSEQIIIAKHLKSISNKIELNNQINQTLEQIAQAIFKSWFVDFDPVKAKIAAKKRGSSREDIERAAMCAIGGISLANPAEAYAKLEQLPAKTQQQLKTTAALFPDEFMESELGNIPKGWEIKQLDNLINIEHGFAFKGNFFTEEPTNNILLTPGNFKIGGGFKLGKLKYYEGPIPKDFVLNQGDLLLTMTDLSKDTDTLGFPALIPEIKPYKFLHNQRLGKVIKKSSRIGMSFLYSLFCSRKYRDEIVGSSTGTTVKHTSPKKILTFKHPFQGALEKIFDEIANNIYREIDSNITMNQVLSNLRDTLLPKLLSGEILPNQIDLEKEPK